ncbi:MAG TPA: hypothetical protein VN622_08465 [Clostridia bacterium]|nr:hypothetical protein [Clostridia bacterium]
MAKSKKPAKWNKVTLDMPNRQLALYTGAKVQHALQEVTMNMDVYQGVRLGEVLEAVYQQGLKDGRREIIEQFEQNITKKVKYLPPGQPRKNRK